MLGFKRLNITVPTFTSEVNCICFAVTKKVKCGGGHL